MGLTVPGTQTGLVIISEMTDIIGQIENDYGYDTNGQIVKKEAGVTTTDLLLTFLYGPEPLVSLKLQSVSDTGNITYPLIALPQPFFETYQDGYLKVRFPRLIIAMKTASETQTTEREAATFEPILRPLKQALFKSITNSLTVVEKDYKKLTAPVKEVPGYAPITENVKDVVDIIEINDLQITFYKSQC